MNPIELIGDLFMAVFPVLLVIGYFTKKYVSKWELSRYLSYIVGVLVLTMSLWAGGIVATTYVVRIIIYSVIYAVVSIITSLLLTMPITREYGLRNTQSLTNNAHYHANIRLPITLIAILTVGWIAGYITRVSLINSYAFDYAIVLELLVLIIVIGLDVGSSLDKSQIKNGVQGLLIGVFSMIGSAIAGILLFIALRIPLPASLGIALGMGWYSLDGPLLTIKFGPAIGTVGFLANFLREQLTYILVPLLFLGGLRSRALIAIGGATSMDDTLPIYRLYMDREGGFTAFVNGFFITVVLPLLLPYIIGL